jgi:Protein of unknown function (DUF664)
MILPTAPAVGSELECLSDGWPQAGRAAAPAGQSSSQRLIYLHMIEEYARHIGHADFLREQIDGATGA